MFSKPMINLRGFTLIELMITLAVATVLLSTALPNFVQAINNNRLATNTNDFIASLNLARSEAIKRGVNVVVARTGTNWEDGWQVFVDVDTSTAARTNVFNDNGDTTLCEAGEDCVLKVYGALPSGLTLRDNGNFAAFITFSSTGRSNSGGYFGICDGSGAPKPNKARLIAVNMTGRVSLGSDANNDGIPNTDLVATSASNMTSCAAPLI